MSLDPTDRPRASRCHLAVDAIDSTSLWLRREINRRATTHPQNEELLAVAATQTGGIGRFGRAWTSPRGGLWMSWARCLNPSTKSDARPHAKEPEQILRGLSLRVACAVRSAVIDTSTHPHDVGTRLRLKWPNDLMVLPLGGHDQTSAGVPRKVGGILIERITLQPTTGGDRPPSVWLIIGVGINANFSLGDLTGELRTSATTLREEFGSSWNLDQLAFRIADLFHALVEFPYTRDMPETIAEFQRSMIGLDESAAVSMPDGSRLAGTLIGLDQSDGLAMVRTAHGEMITVAPGAVIMHPCLTS